MNGSAVFDRGARPGCLIQLLWFALIGWWFGAAWVVLAWLLMVSIIGMPIGAMMLNNVPQVMALRGRRLSTVDPRGHIVNAPELPMLIRIVYFVLIGWWLSALWLTIAYALCAVIIGIPIGFMMFDLTPFVVSLKRI